MILPPIKTDEVFPRDKEFPKFQTAWCQTRRGLEKLILGALTLLYVFASELLSSFFLLRLYFVSSFPKIPQ